MLENTFIEIEEEQTDRNIHAVIDDIIKVSEYIDSKTGNLSLIPETDLVTAIRNLTDAINNLKTVFENHIED